MPIIRKHGRLQHNAPLKLTCNLPPNPSKKLAKKQNKPTPMPPQIINQVAATSPPRPSRKLAVNRSLQHQLMRLIKMEPHYKSARLSKPSTLTEHVLLLFQELGMPQLLKPLMFNRLLVLQPAKGLILLQTNSPRAPGISSLYLKAQH